MHSPELMAIAAKNLQTLSSSASSASVSSIEFDCPSNPIENALAVFCLVEGNKEGKWTINLLKNNENIWSLKENNVNIKV